MKKIINNILIKFTGHRLINNNKIDYFLKNNAFQFVEMVKQMKFDHELIEFFNESKSQLLQELFVAIKLNFKKNGFFVEFGATDGVTLSNTNLLEKKLDWKGILVEPSIKFKSDLINNRNCNIDFRCVYEKSGDLILFNEVEEGEFSSINKYSESETNVHYRKTSEKYEVETITLESLLDEYNSPNVIDYLSIDTEGSEYDILKVFNFNKYRFKIITVEHNYTENRVKIKSLLESKGYKRVYENLSKFDDWYIYDKN